MPADYADKMAAQFATAWEQVNRRVINIFIELQGEPWSEVLEELADIDLRGHIHGLMGGSYDMLEDAYGQMLARITKHGEVSEEVLQALMSIHKDVIVGQVGAKAAQIQELLARHATTGISKVEFVKLLEESGLKRYQAEALANDSLRKYDRKVRELMAQSDDPEKLYIYSGPIDGRVRPLCREMLEAGPLTQKEIEQNFPGAFVNGGGFNCRHHFEPYQLADQYREKEIKKMMEGKAA